MRDRGEHRRGNHRLDGDTVGVIEFFRRAMLCLMQSVPNCSAADSGGCEGGRVVIC